MELEYALRRASGGGNGIDLRELLRKGESLQCLHLGRSSFHLASQCRGLNRHLSHRCLVLDHAQMLMWELTRRFEPMVLSSRRKSEMGALGGRMLESSRESHSGRLVKNWARATSKSLFASPFSHCRPHLDSKTHQVSLSYAFEGDWGLSSLAERGIQDEGAPLDHSRYNRMCLCGVSGAYFDVWVGILREYCYLWSWI